MRVPPQKTIAANPFPIPSNNDTESQNIIISIESIAEVSEEELETPEPSPTMAGFHSANIDFESPLLKPSDMHLGRLRKPDSWKSPMGDETEERSPRGTDHPPSVSASTPSSYLERRSSRPSMESEQTKSSDGDSLDHIIFPTSRNGSDFAAAGRKHYDGIQSVQDVRQFSSDFDLPWCDKDPTAIIDHGTDDNNDIDDDDNKTASIAQLDSQAFEAEAIEFGMDLNAFQREIAPLPRRVRALLRLPRWRHGRWGCIPSVRTRAETTPTATSKTPKSTTEI